MAVLTRSSWIKIAAIVLLGICICTGIGSCSFGCTPLVRGCAAMPGVGSGADYPNVGDASIQASQVRNIELDWFAGRVEFNVVDDGTDAADASDAADATNITNAANTTNATASQMHDSGHEADEHESNGHGASHDGAFAAVAAVASTSEIRLEESAGMGNMDDSMRFRWVLDGDTLRIAYCASSSALAGCSGLNWPSKTLTLTIPKSACEHLGTVSIDAFSGDYNLDSLNCQRLEMDLASGRVDGRGASFGAVDVEVASGTFNLEAQIFDSLALEMASGNANITCSDSAPHTMDVSVASGNTTLTMPADAGITATVNKLSGLFNFDMPDSHTYDDSFICGDGSSQLNVDMSSGNVTVRS